MSPCWCPLALVVRSEVPAGLQDCLFEQRSLSRRLTRRCGGRFEVRVAEQAWGKPLLDEALCLGLRQGSYALLRQVYLLCNGEPWIYARTVIPPAALRGAQRRLATLGTRPLGELLFSDNMVYRCRMAIARIPAGDPRFRLAMGGGTHAQAAALWGRRSVFRLRQRSLLVIEIFLSDRIPPRGHK